VLRQTVGGAVTAFTDLFATKRAPIRALDLACQAGLAELLAGDGARLRGVAQGLGQEPRTGLLIRGAAHVGVDGEDPAALRDLAERRALAVREALVAMGAHPTQVLVGRPLAPDELGRGAPGARLTPIR
jgi:hypothetical protein